MLVVAGCTVYVACCDHEELLLGSRGHDYTVVYITLVGQVSE